MCWAMRLALACVLVVAAGCGVPPPAEEAAKTEPAGTADAPPPWMATAFEQPRGLHRNEPGASPGYVLFAPFNSDTAYLVDLDGRVVHTGTASEILDDADLTRRLLGVSSSATDPKDTERTCAALSDRRETK